MASALTPPPSSPVATGLARLLSDNERLRALRSSRYGLITNPTAVDRAARHAIDLLFEADCPPHALFAPEHGIWGAAQDQIRIDAARDPHTGLPVHSLYGSDVDSLEPTEAMLAGLDLLVFDIQDVGARYYTYVYTLAYAMKAAARRGLQVWALDRPNPITGRAVEGGPLLPECRSFVGLFDLPHRHGLTAGELALLFNKREGINCALDVVTMSGWTRPMWFDQTGLPWVLPSPNMPTPDTALVYPGMCLLEGTELSEGRGTTRPFELWGAPWVDPHRLARALNDLALPGARFRATFFEPTFQKHAGQPCGGVQLHVTDRDAFAPVRTGVHCIAAAYAQWREHRPEAVGPFWRTRAYEFLEHWAIDRLAGSPALREAIERGADLAPLLAAWTAHAARFAAERMPYLLYR